MNDEKIEIVKGDELSEVQKTSMNESIQREFGVPFDFENLNKKLFFLLTKGDDILSMAGLYRVSPVIFSGSTFSLFGVIEVISNQKGKGYGKKVVTALRNYLLENDEIGLGYCMPKNVAFYEKCGFQINLTSGQRFVNRKDGKEITNQDGQVNFYQDNSQGFMEEILEKSGEITIPTDKLW